jgi:hypothetical protein
MQKLLFMPIITALLATGCSSLFAPKQPPDLSLRYHNARYGLTFFLPADWQGYSVLAQQWHGQAYSIEADKLVIVGNGPQIVLRHPLWKASEPYQDIPILVFTRAQWEAFLQGELWPTLYAGGSMDELWHNRKYVFAIYSRYNAGESKGRKEVADIVEGNCAANNVQQLFLK